MRKLALLVAGAAALSAAPALAYLSTTDFGLPQAWTFATNDGYGAIAATYNNASAMCVDCHTVNPSKLIYTPSDATGGPTIDPASTAMRGSHTVMNALMTGKTLFTYTNSGGGFPGGYGPGPHDDGSYMKGSAWTGLAGGATMESKWNTATALPLASGYEVTNSVNVGNAGLICESCHNIRRNTGNSAMLLGAYADNGADTLCLQCHTHGTNTYASFHTNDKLAGFAGVLARKRHHVLTGDTFTVANYGTGNNSVMWAPTFSDKVVGAWCTTPYTTQAAATDLTGAVVSFRNECNVSGVGARLNTAVTGDIVPLSASDIKCTNCHRPHNAMSGGGAFILRTGANAGTDYAGNAGGSGQALGDNIGWGIRRQNDVGTYGIGSKIYGEYNVLCNGCHQGYGL